MKRILIARPDEQRKVEALRAKLAKMKLQTEQGKSPQGAA